MTAEDTVSPDEADPVDDADDDAAPAPERGTDSEPEGAAVSEPADVPAAEPVDEGVAEPENASAAESTTPRFGYQPALDGIRAIAVLLVIGVHISGIIPWIDLPGGWLGVDVFFVLSGYLITSLLLTERNRTGRTNFRNFYVRRLLRLAPLSLAVVAVVWIGARTVPAQTGFVLPNRGALSVIFYYSNWVFMDDFRNLGSLFHCWSLSIEEQFYVVWPAVLIGLLRFGKRHGRALAIALTSAVFIAQGVGRRALWIRAWERGDRPVDIWLYFYGSSLRRPDGLVLGCLLALVLHQRTIGSTAKKIIAGCAVVATVVIALIIRVAGVGTASAPTAPDLFIPRWGLSVFNLCVAVVVTHLVTTPHSIVVRALSWRPCVWIGRRAYGIYLIHPLIFGIAALHVDDWPTIVRAIVGIGGTWAVVAASYRWFEMPFLRRKAKFSSA